MPTRTPIYNFPIYDPTGTDSTELGLTYFNDLTGISPISLTNKLETILNTINSTKSTIHAQTAVQWSSDSTTILKSGEWGIDTTRGVLRLGNGVDVWNDLKDYLPALPVLSGSSAPTTSTVGSLGQLYIHKDATPRLFICVKSDDPYLWMNLSYAYELENFQDIYDANGNGIVDNSEKLGNKLPSYYLNTTQAGSANGIATLDSNSKVPASQLDLTAINADISNVDMKADNIQNIANSASTLAGEAKAAANNKITGGYGISIPTTAWTQSGNTWVATVTDAKIPAETTEHRYAPYIHWNAATMGILTGIGAWAIVETPAAGGSYVVMIGSVPDELPDKPEVALVGEMSVQEVTRK